MDKNVILIIIVILLIIIILSLIIKMKNKMIRTRNKAYEALSDIDVGLAKRYSSLTEMIEVVKGYVKHEENCLEKVTEYRQNMNLNEKNTYDKEIDSKINQIYALAESYPDLKASNNFLLLQKAIADAEEHLQAARRLYNANVAKYNYYMEAFPYSIIASLNNYQKLEFFKATGEEQENVNVNI